MWSAYQLEKYAQESIIESVDNEEVGILIYKMYEDKSCYINTLFVLKEHRNKGIGKLLEKRLIEKEKPVSIVCDVDMKASGAKEALDTFLAGGYEKMAEEDNKVILWRGL